MSFANAIANLNVFTQELKLEGVSFDENKTCILGIDDKFSFHLTYQPQADQLYIYSPLLDGLPNDKDMLLELYQTLLTGSMLGGGMAGGGVGVALKEELILIHFTISMTIPDSTKLSTLAPLFVETIEKWREKCALICGRETDNAKLIAQNKINDATGQSLENEKLYSNELTLQEIIKKAENNDYVQANKLLLGLISRFKTNSDVLPQYKKLLKFFKTHKNPIDSILYFTIYLNRGFYYEQKQDWGKALINYENSLRAFTKIQCEMKNDFELNLKIGDLRVSIANIHVILENYKQAIAMYTNAYKRYNALNSSNGCLIVQHFLNDIPSQQFDKVLEETNQDALFAASNMGKQILSVKEIRRNMTEAEKEESCLLVAQQCYNQDKHKMASIYFVKLPLHKLSSEDILSLYHCYQVLKQYDKLEELYIHAISLNKNLQLYCEHAIFLFSIERDYGRAIALLEKIISFKERKNQLLFRHNKKIFYPGIGNELFKKDEDVTIDPLLFSYYLMLKCYFALKDYSRYELITTEYLNLFNNRINIIPEKQLALRLLSCLHAERSQLCLNEGYILSNNIIQEDSFIKSHSDCLQKIAQKPQSNSNNEDNIIQNPDIGGKTLNFYTIMLEQLTNCSLFVGTLAELRTKICEYIFSNFETYQQMETNFETLIENLLEQTDSPKENINFVILNALANLFSIKIVIQNKEHEKQDDLVVCPESNIENFIFNFSCNQYGYMFDETQNLVSVDKKESLRLH